MDIRVKNSINDVVQFFGPQADEPWRQDHHYPLAPAHKKSRGRAIISDPLELTVVMINYYETIIISLCFSLMDSRHLGGR